MQEPINLLQVNINAFFTIVRKEVIRILRIWVQTILPPCITVALYFLIFGSLMGQRIGKMQGYDYIDYIVPGLIMMSVITNSYMNVVSSFFGSKFQKNIEELLIAPVSTSIIISGYVVGGVVRALIIAFVVSLVSLFFTDMHIEHIFLMLATGILIATLFSLLGLINGIYARTFDDISIIPSFVLTPMTYLGGIFYTLNSLPTFWQTVSYLNPIFYMVNAFRFCILGYTDVSFKLSIAMIVILNIVLFLICHSLLQRGSGIRN